MHSLHLPSCLLITLLATSGCHLLWPDDGDEGPSSNDETGETGEPADDDDDDDDDDEQQPSDPLMPSKTEQPLVEGALWSIRWATTEWIAHAVLAEPGLALANGAHAALVDAASGEPLWGTVAFEDTRSALQLRADELIHGRRIPTVEGYLWELHHYSIAGELEDIEVFPGFDGGPMATDDDGRVFVKDDLKLFAFDGNGASLWSQPLIEGLIATNLVTVEDGVVLVEATPLGQIDLEDLESEYRLRHFDTNGVQLTATGYVGKLTVIHDVALADGRTYVAEAGVYGFPGRIRAVEPEFAGLAWTMELGEDVGIKLEPGLEGGLVALLAGPDAPARVMWIAEDGSVLASRDATSGPAVLPLLVVGAGGELIAGGIVDGALELSRLE